MSSPSDLPPPLLRRYPPFGGRTVIVGRGVAEGDGGGPSSDQVLFPDPEGGVTEPAESQLLELSNALAGEVELLPYLFESARHPVVKAIP